MQFTSLNKLNWILVHPHSDESTLNLSHVPFQVIFFIPGGSRVLG